MSKITRRTFLASTALLAATPALAREPVWYVGRRNIAADGADVVAYFSLAADSNPVKGSRSFEVEWEGATWRFESQENLDLFTSNPVKYAPKYGGYCAWAVANGYTAHGDRNAWHIHEGQLYLNYNKSVRKNWREDIPGNIAKGNSNWPSVLG